MTGIYQLSNQQRLQWLQLIRSENVGPVTFFQLLKKFGSADKALEAIPELARKGGAKRVIRACPKAVATRELEMLEAAGGRMIAACEPDYPPLLKEIHDPPPLISILGHPDLLQKDTIGIVGSRNASAGAIRLTQNFSAELGRAGYVIASGLARGIDTGAHVASLQNGTVAVVGGGLDVVYPKENDALHQEIAARGCIVAEQPLGTQPQARHFPRRNRIISGLSRAILVMEATPKSGSLITARMAAEQGREVFAIPGSPMDPRARGTNNLIRNGAILVESAREIIEELSLSYRKPLAEPDQPMLPLAPAAAPDENALEAGRPLILSLLSPVAVEIDELIRLSQLPPSAVMTILLELELAGRIERHFGNRVSLTV